jgi:hypothetical protein
VLSMQIFPSAWWRLLSVADIRRWSLLTWIIFQGGLLVLLVGVRAWPQFCETLAAVQESGRQRRREADRLRNAGEAKAQRELLERVKAARSRRLY